MAELAPGTFLPKIVTTMREGYTHAKLRADAIAGATVAVVALPLAMALGIASGASPDKGLITAIMAGFLVSALGGSRVQIGGPTGAFVVVVFNVIAQHGYDGLVLATLLAGLMLPASDRDALAALRRIRINGGEAVLADPAAGLTWTLLEPHIDLRRAAGGGLAGEGEALLRAGAVSVDAGTPKKGTNSASLAPKSRSGSMK